MLVGASALGSTSEIQAEPDSSRQPGIDLAPQRSLEAARRLHQAAGLSPPLSPSPFDSDMAPTGSTAVRQVRSPLQLGDKLPGRPILRCSCSKVHAHSPRALVARCSKCSCIAICCLSYYLKARMAKYESSVPNAAEGQEYE